MKYIYHHLGLGDHINCNGLVRHFCELHNEVTVFCKNHYYENVSYMFRDNPKINIFPLVDDAEVEMYIKKNNLYNNLIKVGFGGLHTGNPKTFDIGFYNSVGIPYEYRFSKFKLQRDFDVENQIYNELNSTNEEYIFIHDDPKRGFTIDRTKIRNDLKIIENNTKYNLFNMLSLIENATEVHVMQSSLKDLIISLTIDKPEFYYHTYVRNYSDFYDNQGYNKFTKIK